MFCWNYIWKHIKLLCTPPALVFVGSKGIHGPVWSEKYLILSMKVKHFVKFSVFFGSYWKNLLSGPMESISWVKKIPLRTQSMCAVLEFKKYTKVQFNNFY